MGGTLSHINNKLSFDFDSYLYEREELANELRNISQAAASHRQLKGSLQVVNGASGIAAGIAGGVALVASPITFGLSLPVAATTVAIVGHSITAASVAASAASYSYGHVVDKDIAKRLLNLSHTIHSIAKKDKEINFLMKGPQKEKLPDDSSRNETSSTSENEQPETETGIKACQRLCNVWDEWDLATKENKTVGFDLPLSIIKSQGIVLGTSSIIEGSKQVLQEQELETALIQTANNIDKESATIRKLESSFQYLTCISSEKRLPRGRLTCIDGGGGCVMVVTFDHYGTNETLQSDSTNVIRLPEGVTNVKVHIRAGSTPLKKVDRRDPKQPWIKSDSGEYQVDEFEFDHGDGVNAVFLVKGRNLMQGYVHKAWDFGRHPSVKPRSWEWWENAIEECKDLIPDLEARLTRVAYTNEPCGTGQIGLCCAVAPVA